MTGPGIKYGLFVVRARLSNGPHLWPAIWMLPTDRANPCKYEEIDIMESRGDNTSVVHVTAFHGRGPGMDMVVQRSGSSVNTIDGIDFSARFHEYSMLWNENMLVWYVDDQIIYSVPTNRDWWQDEGLAKIPCIPNVPFDQPFQIILNLAVGGSFFTNYPPLKIEDARHWKNPTLEVDYVRVYRSFF